MFWVIFKTLMNKDSTKSPFLTTNGVEMYYFNALKFHITTKLVIRRL